MEKIKISREINKPVSSVWEVISDLSRTDWVPGVEKIILIDDKRKFFMHGMGEITERILLCDHIEKRLEYSAVNSPVEINHHLATIKLSKKAGKCLFYWVTEIEPEIYGDAIKEAMVLSLNTLEGILCNQLP